MRHPVYRAIDDHSRGLTVEICRARLQQIDEELPGVLNAAKIDRLLESRAWFERQLEKLTYRKGEPSESRACKRMDATV
jgi:hypothetical protein